MNAIVTEQLQKWLHETYDFPSSLSASLFRSLTNDVYIIEDGRNKHVLKIYGAGWRSESEILFEIDLINHLISKGIDVAGVIVGRNGSALQHIQMNGADRLAVLFDFAAGQKPTPPFSPDMYYREGQAAGAMHLAADDFRTTHKRREIDLQFLIHKPLALVESLKVEEDTKIYLRHFGDQVAQSIQDFATKGLDWGICHGDLTFDNFHLTKDDKTVWYDFDSGGFGWRAIDLQGWVASDKNMAERQASFIEGYRTVRKISQNDIDASPYLYVAQEIWGIEIELDRRLLKKDNSTVQKYLDESVEKFKVWQQLFGYH
jgi:Ser/Thr protein kinase RdoA (MazF antagonist)